jgi:hypothetical protein
MAEERKEHHCEGCSMWSHCSMSAIRIVLGLFILTVVFCFGVKIGEFRAEFGGGMYRYGGYRMMGGDVMYYGGPMPMTTWSAAVPAGSVEAVKIAPAKTK